MFLPIAFICTIYSLIVFLFYLNFNYFIFDKYSFKDISKTSFVYELKDKSKLEFLEHKNNNKNIVIYLPDNNEDIYKTKELLKNNLNKNSLILLNYRGFGNSEGKPTEINLKKDTLEFFDFIKKKYPEAKINVVGKGLGSSLAINLSKERQFDKLILISPYDNYSVILQKKYPLIPIYLLNKNVFDNIKDIKKVNENTYLFQFINDKNIPYMNTLKLKSKLDFSKTKIFELNLDSDLIYFEKDFFVKLEEVLVE